MNGGFLVEDLIFKKYLIVCKIPKEVGRLEFQSVRGSENGIIDDAVHLKLILVQCAAVVLECCNNYSYNSDGGIVPQNVPIGRFLKQYLNYTENGYINALQSHVALIYSVVKKIVELEGNIDIVIILEKGEIALLTSALEAYQKYKTEICQAEQKERGKHWSAKTGFFKADWTDQNSKFLALFNRP
ncbi:MAG: hypothetical protein PHW73_05325 [Atribacterota bacterium]|nr:hypothetical protein [Atribacterota bacterium]